MNLTGKPPMGAKPARKVADHGYMARVRALPCAIGYHHGDPCDGAIAAHHVCHDRYGSGRVPDEMTIPLCWGHHQGPNGIHADKSAWRERFGADHEYIAWTRDMLEAK